jgi:hypothetical protein
MEGHDEVDATPVVPGVELGRWIARGGTSEVWEGVRKADGRRVAVKVARADRDCIEAVAREAARAAAAASAHVVPVEACLTLEDGRVALVMPLLLGGNLGALVRARGHLAPGEVVTAVAPVAGAVARLHHVGVVHGDISPGNVLLDLDGRPSLSDLGVGRVVGEEPAGVWGTEGYVAPEVLMGADPGPASDVYALGALGWLCLAGAPPGPPGLRSPLAELSRAGEGATAMVATVESAVAAHPEERPDAAELAWALFEAADPAALHLAEGEDDVSAVTFRLRAAAAEPAATVVPRGWGRHHRGRHREHRVHRARWRTAVPGVAVVAVVGTGVAVALAGDAREVAGTGEAVPAAASPRSGGTGPAASPPPDRDVRTRRTAPHDDPGLLLRALAESRAAAWRAADHRLLDEAEGEASPLRLRDERSVRRLAEAGLRYAGLRYDVADVETVSATGEVAVLQARVGTHGYEVVGAGSATAQPAVAGEQVLVELRWGDLGWRVADIRPRA